MSHHYVVSVQQPTTVTQCIKGNFLSTEELDVIVAKSTKLELFNMANDGFEPIYEVQLYGRIAALCKYRVAGSQRDRIILYTADYYFIVLSWNESGKRLESIVSGQIKNRIGRPIDIIPLVQAYGTPFRAFDIYIPELGIKDIRFFPSTGSAVLFCILFEYHGRKQVRVYHLDISNKQVTDNWSVMSSVILPDSTRAIIPLQVKDHLLIVSNTQLLLYNISGILISQYEVALEDAVIWDWLDNDRYLLCDQQGFFYLLIIESFEFKLIRLGRVETTSIIRYINDLMVYMGSYRGPSLLIRLTLDGFNTEMVFNNCGPIVDMVPTQGDTLDEVQILGVGGYDRTTSILQVRSGVKCQLLSKASYNITGLQIPLYLGCWKNNKLQLIVTYPTKTVFYDVINNQVRPSSIPPTTDIILCVYQNHLHFLTIHVNHTILDSVTIPHPIPILFASATGKHYLIASRNQVSIHSIEEKGKEIFVMTTDYEISSVCSSGHHQHLFVAISSWITSSVVIYDIMQSSTPIQTLTFITPIKSSIFVYIPSGLSPERWFLMICCVDGSIHILTLSQTEWIEEKFFHLSSMPGDFVVSILPSTLFLVGPKSCFLYRKNTSWFAATLDYAPLCVASAFPIIDMHHVYFIINGRSATIEIGEIDDVRSVHVRRTPIQDNCVALEFQASTRTTLFLMMTDQLRVNETAYLRLVSPSLLTTLCTLPLKLTEFPLCVLSASLYQLPASAAMMNDEYFIVGTAFVLPSQSEPTSGRILIIKVVHTDDQYQLTVVSEEIVSGGCLALSTYKGRLIVGVNSEIHVMCFDPVSLSLQSLCTVANNIFITHMSIDHVNGMLAVGDIYRSVSVYKLTVEALCGRQLAQLEFIAQEMINRNITAIQHLPNQSDLIAVSDIYGNLCVMGVVEDAEIDKSNPQKRVAVREWFHLDDQINRFVNINLFGSGGKNRMNALALNDVDHTESGIEFALAFCTVSGRIAVMGSLNDQEYCILQAIEEAMNRTVTPVGGLIHEQWRQSGVPITVKDVSYCIDGDLVEMFLELCEEGKIKILTIVNEKLKTDYTLNGMTNYIQDIRTKHLFVC